MGLHDIYLSFSDPDAPGTVFVDSLPLYTVTNVAKNPDRWQITDRSTDKSILVIGTVCDVREAVARLTSSESRGLLFPHDEQEGGGDMFVAA